MISPSLLSILLLTQFSGEKTLQGPRNRLEAVFERASKESDVDGAGLILSSVLSDEPTIRSAFSTSVVLSERSAYILFGGNWGPRARVPREKRSQWSRVLLDTVSARPLLIRRVLRAERYEGYLRRRHSGGAATINSFPFFTLSPYADDLVELYIESLRQEINRPPRPILVFNHVAVTAIEHEGGLLTTWQMLCGLCDRLDLIDKATSKNWRSRFPDLDIWFQRNRPYILWNESKSCIRIDENAKRGGSPTLRESRFIPELKPPWLSEDELKAPPPRN